jgi:hypothetical protein
MWSSIIPLILFVCLGIVVLVIFEYRARKEKNNVEQARDVVTEQPSEDDGCCGEHLVCERETLLQTNAKVEYYDDEELDTLAGIAAEDYTKEQYQMIREVFETLKASDVPGWVRSIQLRNIQLPLDIREEALLIVVERRNI